MAQGPGVIRDPLRSDSQPFHVEEAGAPKYLSEEAIADVDLDSEFLLGIVVPLTYVGDSREDHWKSEANHALVQALIAAAHAQPAARIDREDGVGCQMRVGAKFFLAIWIAVLYFRDDGGPIGGLGGLSLPRQRAFTWPTHNVLHRSALISPSGALRERLYLRGMANRPLGRARRSEK